MGVGWRYRLKLKLGAEWKLQMKRGIQKEKLAGARDLRLKVLKRSNL
jgi:hypothetical protein